MKRAACVLAVLAICQWARAERYALLIGINKYPQLPARFQLEGCENDVRLMAKTLQERFQFAPKNVRVLLNEQATAEGIRLAFRQHLIEGSRPGDVALLYYSGHGAQVPDQNGDETDDKMDEILCSSDIRVENKNWDRYVLDDDLSQWTQELKGREFIAIFDCCHSGTGLKDLGLALEQDPRSASRFLSLNQVLAEGARALPPLAELPEPPLGEAYYRELRDTGGASSLLAACAPSETAQETEFDVEGGSKRHGAFTMQLLKALPSNRTYGALGAALEAPIETSGRVQHPQVECQPALLDKPLFGVRAAEPTPTPAPTPAATPAPTAAPTAAPSPASPSPTPARTPAATPAPGPPPSSLIGILHVRLAPFAALAGGSAPAIPEVEQALRGLLRALPFAQLAESVNEADTFLFYESSGRGAYVIGTASKGGEVTFRQQVASLQPEALKPVQEELQRLYLVVNLERMESPESPIKVSLWLGGPGGRRLRLGDPIQFHVRSSHAGFLTLLNIDCKGQVHRLFPNEYAMDNRIEAGKEIILPNPPYDLKVIEPVGRELVKAFVSVRPLEIPVITSQPSQGGMKSIANPAQAREFVSQLRGIGVELKTQDLPSAGGLEQIKPNEAGIATLHFATTP